mmetsp:Transcript_37238/g.73167  ORF Transcript_37238/g.73167 Transcript_37238/m.73167 type:complete len:255 (+) Transcript_37238:1-765(+)
MKFTSFLLLAVGAVTNAKSPASRSPLSVMDCGGAELCGVLTLETGFGPGVYGHHGPSVHGLWPQVAPYGNSGCAAPQDKTAPKVVYPCYYNGHNDTQLTFEEHEWGKHGVCAGLKDVDTFFDQICNLSQHPLALMSQAGVNLANMQQAVENAGYEVFFVDHTDQQLQLSTCYDPAAKAWVLVPVAQFSEKCGGPGPPTTPTPAKHPTPASGECLPNQRGPPCGSDSDCTNIKGCIRCAHSGFCTSTPLENAEYA